MLNRGPRPLIQASLPPTAQLPRRTREPRQDKIVKMSTSDSGNPSLLERILAIASLSIIGAALLSFFVTLIIGLNEREAMASGWLPIVYGVSIYALPVGFVLLVALLIIAQRRRKREAAEEAQGRKSVARKRSGNPKRNSRG